MADYLFACSTASGQWLYGKKVISKKNFKKALGALYRKRLVEIGENGVKLIGNL